MNEAYRLLIEKFGTIEGLNATLNGCAQLAMAVPA
jgi:hypothetical protein